MVISFKLEQLQNIPFADVSLLLIETLGENTQPLERPHISGV